ncbi:MAG: CopG family transcriptional regulator [Acidobacteriota bacterium]
MAQITIYLDGVTEALVEAAVRQSGLSKSRWIAQAIRARAGGEWPASVAALHGAWSDFPSLDEIRKSPGRDRKRERL